MWRPPLWRTLLTAPNSQGLLRVAASHPASLRLSGAVAKGLWSVALGEHRGRKPGRRVCVARFGTQREPHADDNPCTVTVSFSPSAPSRHCWPPTSAQWPPHSMGKKGGKAPALATEPEELKHLGAPCPLASSAHATTASRIASRTFLARVPLLTSPSAQSAHGAASSSPSDLPLLPPPPP